MINVAEGHSVPLLLDRERAQQDAKFNRARSGS